METAFAFTARLLPGSRGLTGVELTPEKSRALGTKRQVGVIGVCRGETFKTNAHPTGRGTHFVPFNRSLREKLRLSVGDEVSVELRLRPYDDYVMPPELAEVLARDASARDWWSALKPGHRRTGAEHISGGRDAAERQALMSDVLHRAERHFHGGTFWLTPDDYGRQRRPSAPV